MKRRDVLKIGALTLFTAASGAYWLSQDGLKTPQPVREMADRTPMGGQSRKTLITVFLRGGMDGMSAVVPYTEPAYYDARPRLAVPRPGQEGGALDLDGRFGLHPALGSLLPLYQEGSLAVIQAIGTECTERSHLWCERYLETGGDKSADADGWLNRYAQRMRDGSDIPTLSAHSGIPALLMGAVPTLSMTGMQDLQPRVAEDGMETAREAILSGDADALHSISDHTFKAQSFLRKLDPARYPSAAEYPPNSLGNNFRLLAFLLKSGLELRAAYVEQSEYDTHAGQLGGTRPLDRLFDDLSRALAAFWKDLGPLQDQVVVATLTEFGRRLKENGTLGTDHGWATSCFVLGGTVRGGKVYGTWPGLDEGSLFEGIDLKVTTDYRDLFIEVADGLGCPDSGTLFANHSPGRPLGILA